MKARVKQAGDRLSRRAEQFLEDIRGGVADSGQRDEIVRFCLTRDWIRRSPHGFALTDAGRAYLRRQSAAEDAFAAQHQVRETIGRGSRGEKLHFNHAESPLGWLRRRKNRNGVPMIDAAQFAAGERLRADHWRSQLSQKVTSNWSGSAPIRRSRRAAPQNPAALQDDVIAAKGRYHRALDAVGPELSGVLVDVCCELKGLEDFERAQGWPQRAGKLVLQIALTRLARHYGLIRTDGDGPPKRLRHWGAEDYRPKV